MKKIIFIQILFVCTFSFKNMHAQKEYHIKLYNNIKYTSSHTSQSDGVVSINKTMDWLKLMPAFSISTKGRSSVEFVISSFSHKKTYSSYSYPDSLKLQNREYQTKAFNIGIQFIRYFYVATSCKSRLNYFIGAGIEPVYNHQKSIPNSIYSFSTSKTNFLMHLYLIPRVSYIINEKLNLELNMPLNFSSFDYESNKVENPSFTRQQQKTSSYSFHQFPKQFMANLGLAFRL